MSGESNTIQLDNIARLWVALGRTGPAPRPARYEEALELLHQLRPEFGARRGHGIVPEAPGDMHTVRGVPCAWCKLFDHRPGSVYCSEICERLATTKEGA